ncbi:MAG TPA: haloacid dehalogenase, partial [Amnibacterium sp.]|nr:haloacid dehalogenase [Amnibacterium sp.]
MGDVLVSGPAVRAVAARAEVLLLAGPQGAAAARLLPGVAAVEVVDAAWITGSGAAVDPALVARIAGIVAGSGIEEAVILTSFH